MATIIPRWEWRTFGSSFGAADDALSELASGGDPVESEELYLVSTDDANVKVRDGLMDIKVPSAAVVNPEKLQRVRAPA